MLACRRTVLLLFRCSPMRIPRVCDDAGIAEHVVPHCRVDLSCVDKVSPRSKLHGSLFEEKTG